jgi:hypothetical protein
MTCASRCGRAGRDPRGVDAHAKIEGTGNCQRPKGYNPLDSTIDIQHFSDFTKEIILDIDADD